MQFKVGRPMVIHGPWDSVKYTMMQLSVSLQKDFEKILFIDTTNSLNPHSKAYLGVMQEKYFKNIYCVRAVNPYELWQRLNTAEKFIKYRKVESLIINCLSKLFVDSNAEEIKPVMEHILNKIKSLTKKYNLVTFIGDAEQKDKNIAAASQILLNKIAR